MKKYLYACVTLLLIFSLALTGCTGNTESAEEPEGNDSEPLKVALLLAGPITDQGWNAMAYSGLIAADETYDIETTYTESVAQSDREEVFRGYATQGYDLIIGHGFDFLDAGLKVAESFPDVKFVITSTTASVEPNVGSVSDDGLMKGFLGGVVAGVLTETDTVAFIGGLKIPPIMLGQKGFEAGVKYVNPDANVLSTMSGTFEDAGVVKEIALSMIDQGADLILAQADSASLGSIEACEESGIRAIGINGDQNSLAPDTVVTSAMADFPLAMSLVIGQALDGTWEPVSNIMGVQEGVVGLAPYHGFEDKLTDEQKAEIEAVYQGLLDGSIELNEIIPE